MARDRTAQRVEIPMLTDSGIRKEIVTKRLVTVMASHTHEHDTQHNSLSTNKLTAQVEQQNPKFTKLNRN